MPSNQRIPTLRLQAFKRQEGMCYYCGVRMWLSSPEELPGLKRSAPWAAKLRCTAEHLTAQSDGGRDTVSNIVAACAHCNHTRHKRKNPPEPLTYRNEVRRRVARGAWHASWVFAQELLRPASDRPPLVASKPQLEVRIRSIATNAKAAPRTC